MIQRKSEFSIQFSAMQRAAFENSKAKGFTPDLQPEEVPVNKIAELGMICGEAGECIEAVRMGRAPDAHCPTFSNEEIELADIVLRCMNYAERYNIPLAAAIEAKHAFNTTRPYKHGGKIL